jgi:hypothetical protein
MRILIAALALILWVAFGLAQAIAQNPSDKERRENLDLQERCGVQAEKVFERWKTEDEQVSQRLILPTLKTLSADYQSHYNTTLHRCFMTILTTMENGSTNKWLIDAFENRLFAFYLWMPDPKGAKKYWEVRPLSCELTPSIREKHLCSSEDEYEEFVAAYMSQ